MLLLWKTFFYLIQFLAILLAFLILTEQYKKEKNYINLSYIETFGILVAKNLLTFFMHVGVIYYGLSLNNWWYPILNETLLTLFYLMFIIIIYLPKEQNDKKNKILLLIVPILVFCFSLIVLKYWINFLNSSHKPFYKFWGNYLFAAWQALLITVTFLFMFFKDKAIPKLQAKKAFYFFLIASIIVLFNLIAFSGEMEGLSLSSEILMFAGFIALALDQFKSKLQIKFLLIFFVIIIIPGILTILLLPEQLNEILTKLPGITLNYQTIDLSIINIIKIVFFSLGLGIIIAILTAFLIGKRIITPIKILVYGTKQIAKGNLDYQITINRNDELGWLSEDFNRMTKKLKQTNENLNNKINEMETIHKLSKVINSCSSLKEMLQFSLDTISISFNVEICTIMLTDKEKNKFKIFESKGISTKTISELNIDFKNEIEPDVLAESEDFTIPDSFEYNNMEQYFNPEDQDKIDKYICVPIRAGEDIIGLFTIHKINESLIKYDEIMNIIPIIASQIAPGINMIALKEKKDSEKINSPYEVLKSILNKEILQAEEYSVSFSLINIILSNSNNKTHDLISKFTEQLDNLLRKNDYIVRYQANKLLVILPLTFKDDTENLLTQIKNKCSDSFSDSDIKFDVLVYPDDADNTDKLLQLI